MHTPPPNPQEKVSKLLQENRQERAPKITKKNEREQHLQALKNHAESSIHHKEVHTRSSLPLDHPSLSQDLTIKLSS
jgi:polyribonucleotide nucleotidyltransferase